ncbi:GNAT family N-acetyltransferase [Maritimibacter sp. 55A14]|uniref:GNAT family N-acetyltransferase n=1 Tax=Maritimibacter sp. 55A14 TaxID=2174844 RepID=UPI001304FBA9|nr:GNAT family N-acetyltransferase [Maritimibacter sp. 55A14]
MFARIVCAGFDLCEAAEPWLARLPEAKGWHAYIAWDGNEPAGCAALFLSGEAAFTDFAATDPVFRKRGVQSANLAYRLHAAREMGVTRVHTCGRLGNRPKSHDLPVSLPVAVGIR